MPVLMRSDASRIKELESELRIAKEVSVRLHNELEQSEDKRYGMQLALLLCALGTNWRMRCSI